MNTAAVRADWVGQIIDGRFTLLQWLGSSARRDVFLTELQGQGSQRVAIKLIAADANDREAYLSRWQTGTTLSHPHLMRLFHTGHCQINGAQRIYVVMEYAEEDLSQILPQRPLTPHEAREMLNPVLDALSYLHQKGFVHGHLKPSNIMVVDDQLKLSCDSLHAQGEPALMTEVPIPYAPPEAATARISPAADVWSLGVSLVEALTQRPPAWDRATPGDPVVPESIPQLFADIARECLRSDPVRRCTVAEIKARLEPIRPLQKPASMNGEKAPAKLGVKTLIAAALILLAVIVVLKSGSRPPRPSLPPTQAEQPPRAIAEPAPTPTPGNQTPKDALVKGAVAQRVPPDVPRSASRTIQGRLKVKIRVTVDPSGEVSSVKVESPGPSKYFANLALQAARQWKFTPAQVDGQAVSSVWILRFEFARTGAEVTPIETSP
jgi:TonB family protein